MLAGNMGEGAVSVLNN